METFSALLAICAGNSQVTSEFHSQRPVTRSFGVFFDLRLNNGWISNREAGDLRRHHTHYDVTIIHWVMYPTYEFNAMEWFGLSQWEKTLSQWETTLQCNMSSHWLCPYLEWSQQIINNYAIELTISEYSSFNKMRVWKWTYVKIYCMIMHHIFEICCKGRHLWKAANILYSYHPLEVNSEFTKNVFNSFVLNIFYFQLFCC